MQLTFEEKYNAIGKKESTYEGIFITAVKSTKIFCRPSCRARKPLAKNVEFFETAQQALQHGYRPCKVCRPMEQEGTTPDYIKDLIVQIHKEPFKKMKDWDLKQMGLEPNHVRRWFKSHHNMTFQAYQRMVRINYGYHQIKSGEKVVDAAFESGYESLSGFAGGYKTLFGKAPSKNEGKAVIYIDRFTTPLGAMYAGATEKGLCLLEFTDRRMLETEFEDLKNRCGAVLVPGENNHIKEVKQEIGNYFEQKIKKFTVSLDPQGTDFQKSVWKVLQTIPYGETWSYLDQAKKLGKPKSVRAVANANGMNKISIIIPCHRVIGSDGNLTGYGGGLPRKKRLLELEQKGRKF